MKVYKLIVQVIDFDDLGSDEIINSLENARFPNDCLTPKVREIEHRDIGEWDDNHPLNKKDTALDEFKRLFSL